MQYNYKLWLTYYKYLQSRKYVILLIKVIKFITIMPNIGRKEEYIHNFCLLPYCQLKSNHSKKIRLVIMFMYHKFTVISCCNS
jgi:hypothetical protein